MKEKNKTIGFVITDLRQTKKISQKTLAVDLRIGIKKLRSIEDNTIKPDGELLQKIADYFELPISALLFKAIPLDELMKNPALKKCFEAASPIVDALMFFLLDVKKPINEVVIKKGEISDN